MSSYDAPTGSTDSTRPAAPLRSEAPEPPEDSPARVGTIVWGLIVVAPAVLIIVAQLGIVALNGTYVVIGLMIGAGAALVIGGLLSARSGDKRDKAVPTGKS